MTTAPSPDPGPSISRDVAAILALVAVAVTLGILSQLIEGQNPSLAAVIASWDWVFTVALVIVVVVIVVWLVRLTVHGVTGRPRRGRHERRLRHHEDRAGVAVPDSAVEIARERYARGEISSAQLEETLRQLAKGS